MSPAGIAVEESVCTSLAIAVESAEEAMVSEVFSDFVHAVIVSPAKSTGKIILFIIFILHFY